MEDVKIKKGRESLEPRFWQARVRITQIPSEIEEQIVSNPSEGHTVELDKSWLYDPFLDRTIYGLELTLAQSFSWIFFLNAYSKAEALRKGHSYLMVLQDRFSGLTGNVEILPITSSILHQDPQIYELVLPPQPYNEREKWSFIKKIIQLFRNNEHSDIQFYIFWQRDDSVDRVKLSKSSLFELYKLKIFIRFKEKVNNSEVKVKASTLYSQLEYLVMGIRNLKGERATVKRTYLNKWEHIVAANVFWVNKDDIHTQKYYLDIAHKIPQEKLPSFITPDRVDFSFQKEIPLLRAHNLPYENINYTQESVENRGISVGSIVHNGVLTKNIKYLPIDHFAHSLFIAGQPGTGKTYLLGHICKELQDKFNDLGVLILNLGKARQEGYYHPDEILKYGSAQFHLNYFYAGEYLDRALQETASYLIAALGLGSPCDKILYNVMTSFIEVNGCLPPSLKKLFEGLKKWFKTYPYYKKFQTNILRALQNRVLTILSDSILEKTLELSSASEIPSWFQKWREGKTVYIDLSMCNMHVKRLVSSAIFQMVKTLTPDIEAGRLQNVIVIDEAHQLLEKPISSDPDSDEFISKQQLELIFNNLIREFRSKGLSFFLIANVPHQLFHCATTLPSLKILFCLSHLDNNVFTRNSKIQDYLVLQKQRNALIMNGNNEEFFVVHTPDFHYSLK